MTWFKRLQKRFADESGDALLLVALSFVVICGMCALAADLGSLYLSKQRLQSSTEAAALSGADTVFQGNAAASQTATQTAEENDPKATYANPVIDTSGTVDTVEVSADQTVPMFFARMLGWHKATVSAASKAEVGALDASDGIAPLQVPEQTFTYGEQVALTEGAGDGESGNYGYLDFSGLPGATQGFSYYLEHGSDFPLYVGEQVYSYPGKHTGPADSAIQARIADDSGRTACQSYQTAVADCSRVMYLPVVSNVDYTGKTLVTIVGFAAFYLEELKTDSGGNGHNEIIGQFIRMIRPGTIGSSTNYGTYAVKLIQP